MAECGEKMQKIQKEFEIGRRVVEEVQHWIKKRTFMITIRVAVHIAV